MKNKNYRLILKITNGNISYFIEQKVLYFFGLFSRWDLLEITTNFKSELEAERFLKQLEIKKALFDSNVARKISYYDVNTDSIIK